MTNHSNVEHAPASQAKEIHRHHLVYGQRLCSNWPLPELPRASFNERDISFRYNPSNGAGGAGVLVSQPGRLLTRRSTNLGCDLSVYDTEADFLLRWEGQCDFLVSKGGWNIECHSRQGGDPSWAQSTLYGVVLSFALHLLKVGNFHASAVVLPGGAIGFLAEPGSGKSTLAGLFAAKGYPFLTDDVLTLEKNGQGYVAHPGFPFVSLSRQSVEAMIDSTRKCKTIPLNAEKQRVAVDGTWASFCQQPVPLRALFVLSRGPEGSPIDARRLPRVEAMRSLLQNTNCLPLLPAEAVAQQMTFINRLTASVPVWRLAYPTGFHQTPKVMEKVVRETAYALL